MRYGRAERLIELALEMQAARGGLSIVDIMDRFAVSRRTAFRMRDAVLRAFPQATEVETDERIKRWRVDDGGARLFAGVNADDLAALETAAQALAAANLGDHAERLRALGAKWRAVLRAPALRAIEPDLEALVEAEGLAHRPGPRPLIPASLFQLLREAIKSCRQVAFDYRSRATDAVQRRAVCPMGFLYGHRHYLVALQPSSERLRFFSLPAIGNAALLPDSFERPADFDLKAIVSRCFGVFEEAPVNVAWRFSPQAAPAARQFLFHPHQTLEDSPDGSVTVRFHAGGQLEMAWHLMAWGRHVEVLEPAALKALMPHDLPDWPALP